MPKDCSLIEKIAEMAKKETRALVEDIPEPTFNEYFQSRIIRTNAKTAFRYAIKVQLKTLAMPLYWSAFRMQQLGSYARGFEKLSRV